MANSTGCWAALTASHIHMACPRGPRDSAQSSMSRSNSGYSSLVVTPRITAERKEGTMDVQREVTAGVAETLGWRHCPDPRTTVWLSAGVTLPPPLGKGKGNSFFPLGCDCPPPPSQPPLSPGPRQYEPWRAPDSSNSQPAVQGEQIPGHREQLVSLDSDAITGPMLAAQHSPSASPHLSTKPWGIGSSCSSSSDAGFVIFWYWVLNMGQSH